MNTIQRIAKNFSITGASQIISSLFGFFILIYIARYLGDSLFGKYCFALSFASFFIIISDLGISQYIIREISRKEYSKELLISNIYPMKLILSIVAFLLMSITINLTNYPNETIFLTEILGIYLILNSLASNFTSIFQALEKMEYNAFIVIIDKLIAFPLILCILSLDYGLIGLGYVYILIGLIDLILSFLLTKREIPKLGFQFELAIWKDIVYNSFPFAINIVFASFFFRIDTIILSIFVNDAVVGIYNAAYTPLLAICGILSVMAISALYPVMSKYYITSRKSLERIVINSSKYMAMIGFPIAVGCIILGKNFIELFYGNQYSESIVIFQVLALFIPIRLISSITGTLLTSIDKQNIRTIVVAISALFNIIINIIIIPYLGGVGAALATIISEFFLYILYIHFTKKFLGNIPIHRGFIKPAFASIIMGIFLYKIGVLNLIIQILISVIIYSLTLLGIRAFDEDDKIIINLLIKRGIRNDA
ncbi:flippase [Methanothrix sp.]|uniref:flippase n=1 Tax=Methanothrix sp. TaxID=90426 RepID=UPI003BB4BA02